MSNSGHILLVKIPGQTIVSVCLLAAALTCPAAALAAPDPLPWVVACGSGGQIEYMESAPENAPPYWKEQVAAQYPTSMCVFMKRPSAQTEAGRPMILPSAPNEDALGKVLASIVGKREQEQAAKQSQPPADLPPPLSAAEAPKPAPEDAPAAAPLTPVASEAVPAPAAAVPSPETEAPRTVLPETPALPAPAQHSQPEPEAVQPVPAPHPEPSPKPAPLSPGVAKGKSEFAAQILSVSGDDIERSRGAWQQLVGRAPALKPYEPTFVRAVVNGSPYVRIRIAPLGFSEAGRLCDRLKADGLGCFVVRNEPTAN